MSWSKNSGSSSASAANACHHSSSASSLPRRTSVTPPAATPPVPLAMWSLAPSPAMSPVTRTAALVSSAVRLGARVATTLGRADRRPSSFAQLDTHSRRAIPPDELLAEGVVELEKTRAPMIRASVMAIMCAAERERIVEHSWTTHARRSAVCATAVSASLAAVALRLPCELDTRTVAATAPVSAPCTSDAPCCTPHAT